ncbi:U3 snoRNP protein [Blastocladiella emersonii ATCC 22665]|nr:U3 snoRNP protein [Blastocladiella emersonii ATCC 22665]
MKGKLANPATAAAALAADSDDDALFFQDTEGVRPESDAEAEDDASAAPPAKKGKWHDDDDDEIEVDLTSANRLRKLRATVEDNVVTGSELTARLTAKFAANGTPAWAQAPSVKQALKEEKLAKAKKRKLAEALRTAQKSGKKDHEAAVFGATRGEGLDQDELDVFGDGASLSDSEDEDDADLFDVGADDDDFTGGVLASTASLIERSRTVLPKESLAVARIPNLQYVHSSITSAIAFHPTANVLVTAGLDRTVRLSQIDGRENPVLGRVFFKDLPVHALAMHPEGTHVFATGRRNWAYEYHLETGAITKLPPITHIGDAVLPSLENMHQSPSGKYLAFVGGSGNIILLDGKTKKWVCNLKMNGSLRSVAWADDNTLSSIGGDGVVYVWDVAARRCIAKWGDVGGFKNTAIAVSRDANYLATGSPSGIVNVYSTNASELDTRFRELNGPAAATFSAASESTASPLASMTLAKAVDNLTTPIHNLRFNHDAQVLGIISRAKKDQLKLVHLPTCQVFGNWPTQRTPLSYVQCVDFSPHSGLVAIGNDKGRVLLYKLKHYPSY